MSVGRRVVAQFVYRDEEGRPIARIDRIEPGHNGRAKDFLPYQAAGTGFNQRPGLNGTALPVYQLEDVRRAVAEQQRILFCEGEGKSDLLKAALKAASLGAAATTIAGGANAPLKPLHVEQLRGARSVIVLADSDKPGRASAAARAEMLRRDLGPGTDVRDVDLYPDRDDGSDIADWLKEGHAVQELRDIIQRSASLNSLTSTENILDTDEGGVGELIFDDDADATTIDQDTALALAGHKAPDDVANSDVFAQLNGADLRFDYDANGWRNHDSKRWRLDVGDQIAMRRAKGLFRGLSLLAAKTVDLDRSRLLAHYASRCSTIARVQGMLKLAQSAMPIDAASLDRDPYTFNANNCTIDLRTGLSRPHNADDRLSRVSPIDYDPGAACPRWDLFLREVFCERRDLVEYVQMLVGYSMTGDPCERVLIICHGNGRNGKSKLINTIGYILGEYAAVAPMTLFLTSGRTQQAGAATPELMALRGRRFVSAGESDKGSAFAEATIKLLAGADRLTGRPMYGSFVEFDPTAHFWLGTNHPPRIKGGGPAIWDRIRMIPFVRRFEGADEDKALEGKLRAEAEGILAWAVRGCLLWQQRGLVAPQPVVDATGAYRSDQDTLGAFLESETIEGAGLSIHGSALSARYEGWCKANLGRNEEQLGPRKLFAALRELGWQSRKSNGETVFASIGLRDHSRNPDDDPAGLSDRDRDLHEAEGVPEVSKVTISKDLQNVDSPGRDSWKTSTSGTLGTSGVGVRENAGRGDAGRPAPEWDGPNYACMRLGCPYIGRVRKSDGLCERCATAEPAAP